MAEEIVFKFGVDSEAAKKSVGDFKAQLKEANGYLISAVQKFGEMSPQAIAAAKAVGKLRDEMQDAKELSANLIDERRFSSIAGLAGSVAGGFSAMQGAITLATGDSKEFEKAMLKVQSAMAISQGLAQVSELGKQWNTAKAAIGSFTIVQKANTAATAAATAVTKLFGVSVNTTSTGFKILRGAIAATGIGLLIVAIGAIVQNFNSLKETLFKLIPFLETVADFIGTIVEAVTDFVGITSEASRAADKLRDSIKSQNEHYERALELLEASGRSSKEVRAYKNAMYQDEINNLNKIISLGQTLSDDEKKRLDELKFKQQILKAEQQKEDADKAAEAAKKAEEEKKKQLEEAKRLKKQQDEEAKKKAEDLKKELADAVQKQIDSQKELHAYQLELAKLQKKDIVAIREEQIDEEIALLAISGAKYKDEIVKLEREKVIVAEEAKAAAQEEIDEKKKEQDDKNKEVEDQLKADADALREENEATELLRIQEKYDAMRAIVGNNEVLLTQITEAEAAARHEVTKKYDQLTIQAKREQIGILGSVLGNASALFGKHTAAGKGLAIAETLINTWKGATSAISATAGLGPFGVALGIANAAIVVANGIKNVREITKTKIPGAADSGGGVSAPSASSAGSSPAVSTAPTMEGIQSTLAAQAKQVQEGKEPLKAYVVESEITQKQERARAITQTANF